MKNRIFIFQYSSYSYNNIPSVLEVFIRLSLLLVFLSFVVVQLFIYQRDFPNNDDCIIFNNCHSKLLSSSSSSSSLVGVGFMVVDAKIIMMQNNNKNDNSMNHDEDNNNSDNNNNYNNNGNSRHRYHQQQERYTRNNHNHNHNNKKKNYFSFDRKQQQHQRQKGQFSSSSSNPFEVFSRYILYYDNINDPIPNQQQQQQQQQYHHHRRTKKLLSLFPTHKPRHIIEGITLLVRSMVIGVTMGILSFIAIPMTEYLRIQKQQQQQLVDGEQKQSIHDINILSHNKKNNRWVGLFIGGIHGAIYGSTFTLVGCMNGFVQFVRGIIQTPIAIHSIHKGMLWDTKNETWKYYYLSDELNEIESYQPFQDEHRPVKDLTYYNMLNIPTNANEKDIKRAYRTKARSIHPDKNLGNSSAVEEFRLLHTAYLTLMDTDKRMAYDTWGFTSLQRQQQGDDTIDNSSSSGGNNNDAPGISELDPNVFVSVLFNSRPVEQYIGYSSIASFAKQTMHLQRSGYGNSIEDVLKLVWNNNNQYQNRGKYVHVAIFLNNMVSSVLNDTISKSEYRIQCHNEAMRIVTEPFGIKYLLSIGTILQVESNRYIINRKKLFGSIQSSILLLRNKLSTIQTAGIAIQDMVHAIVMARDSDISMDNEQELIKLLLPGIFDIIWLVNVVDISHTIRIACRKLFSDASVISYKQRLERAEAIHILAEEFLLVAHEAMEDTTYTSKYDLFRPEHLVARFEVATEISVMKASGFEVPEAPEQRIQEVIAKQG